MVCFFKEQRIFFLRLVMLEQKYMIFDIYWYIYNSIFIYIDIIFLILFCLVCVSVSYGSANHNYLLQLRSDSLGNICFSKHAKSLSQKDGFFSLFGITFIFKMKVNLASFDKRPDVKKNYTLSRQMGQNLAKKTCEIIF